MNSVNCQRSISSARQLASGSLVIACLSLVVGVASGSAPTSNELGVRFKLISSGPTATVEIHLSPRRAFDAVTVEAASGVASLTPPCAFAGVVVGGAYACRVVVTGKPTDAAMTLKVIARRSLPGGILPETEFHHFSINNQAFMPSRKLKAASHHVVASSPATSK